MQSPVAVPPPQLLSSLEGINQQLGNGVKSKLHEESQRGEGLFKRNKGDRVVVLAAQILDVRVRFLEKGQLVL